MEQFPVFRFGDFVLDRAQRRLLRSGEDVYLPPKTFELLLHLVQNRGRVLSKDELLQAVWPDVSVVENTLAQRVREIREALGDGAHGARFIKTVPKVGYQFIAQLNEDMAGGTAPPPAIASLDAAGAGVAANEHQHRALPVAIACVVLVALTGAGYYFGTRRPALPVGSPAITSIAVLPFKPLVAEGPMPPSSSG
jgi:adenylate cyclase